MKIHLQSDTHIEMGPAIEPTCISDVAVCAGDIGLLNDPAKLEAYFDAIKQTTDHIIWVLGNHEFYHYDYQLGLQYAAEFAEKQGIHLLDEALGTENLEIDGIKFWGSTLWTDMNNSDWFVTQKVGKGFNDFRIITNGDKQFSFQDTIEINKRTREKINWDADVIVTHHCPIVIEHRRFPVDDITYGFCNTGLDQQIMDSNVKYWLYGHTHDSRHVDLNGTHIVSNQQGYKRSSWQTGEIMFEDCHFDPGLILEI